MSSSSSIAPSAVLTGHKGCVTSLDVSLKANANLLASGSEDATCRLWDIRLGSTSKCIKCFAAFPQDQEVTSVAFAPASEHLLYVASSNNIACFDLRASDIIVRQATEQYSFNQDEINKIVFNSTETQLCACDDTGELKILNLAATSKSSSNTNTNTNTNQQHHQQQQDNVITLTGAHTNICSTVCYRNNNENELFSGGFDCLLVHWDIAQRRAISAFNLAEEYGMASSTQMVNPPFVHDVAVSNSGRFVAAALGNGQCIVLEYPTSSSNNNNNNSNDIKSASASASASPQLFAELSSNNQIINMQQQQRKGSIAMAAHSHAVTQVEFAAFDSEWRVITGGLDCNIIMWDLRPFREQAEALAQQQQKFNNSKAGKQQRRRGGGGGGESKQKPVDISSLAPVIQVRIPHGSKVNCLKSCNRATNNLFVGDETNAITVYSLPL